MKFNLHGSCAALNELTACELAPGVSSQHSSSFDGHVLTQYVCRVSCAAAQAKLVDGELHAQLGVGW